MLILNLNYKILLILDIIMPILLLFSCIFAAEIVPVSQLNFYFMEGFKKIELSTSQVAYLSDLLAERSTVVYLKKRKLKYCSLSVNNNILSDLDFESSLIDSILDVL